MKKILLLSCLVVSFAAPSLHALDIIDTLPAWNGSTYISSFGVTDTATYGQTITIAAGTGPLLSYSFEIGNCGAAVKLRGEIYAWDSATSRATGPSLFESPVYTVPNSSSYTHVGFNTGGLELPPGTYVFFASTSKDQAGAPASACRWGSVGTNTAYPGGQFVFLNNGPTAGLWTTAAWSTIAEDLAFQATFAALDLVDTRPAWNGSDYISSFGVVNTATYGQTITIPAGAAPLLSYSFEIGNCGAAVNLRGEIYAWDLTTSRATGPSLFESPVYSVPNSSSYTHVTFHTGGLVLPAGTYVFFASTSKDQAGAPASACRWGSVANTAYTGGQFVFLNNGPTPALWTTTAWSTIAQDLAFQLAFAAPSPVPPDLIDTLAGWDGGNFISSFGVVDTATYGQTMTIAAGTGPLQSFSFEIGNCGAAVNLRGEIYAWNPATGRATGPPLFESPVYSLANASSYTHVGFNTGGLVLPAGTYVFFASTSKDQAGAPNSACRWGSVGTNTAYPGGQFVFLNNGPTPALWTTTAWSTIAEDLAFQATFFAYPLTVAKTGSGAGTVTSSPPGITCGTRCSDYFGGGTVVTLTATPSVGSTFTGWSGACSGSAATCNVTMDAAKSVTATFTLNTYALTVARAGTGSGTVTAPGIDCGSACSQTYPYGTVVTLTATPAAGSTFTGWSGACSGSAATCNVTMDGVKSVTATFTLNTYALTVTRAGTGSGTVTASGIDCGSDCGETYAYGTVVTLTATPAAGSVFDGWSGDCSGSSPTCSVTIAAATSVTATFTQVAGFYAVDPCRVLDTRDPSGPAGPALAAGEERRFVIVGECSIPSTATAVSVNLTVTNATTVGHLRVYPGGASLPLVSAINYVPGQNRANNAIVPLGTAGDLAVYCGQAFGTVEFILDISGYFR